jgi:hypothetical protein
MDFLFRYIGVKLARFLSKPRSHYEEFSTLSQQQLQQTLKPGDLLLVEGNSRVSTAIKYLTQSTWSHVCLFVGEQDGVGPLIEADMINGVSHVPLKKYDGFNVRICRAFNLTEEDKQQLLSYAIAGIGLQYDMKNLFDLMRYLIPTPPIPMRYRRKLIAFGSGAPTKAICSTFVAQAFQSIRYPILPREIEVCQGGMNIPCEDVVLERKHFSHFTPRDFDLSPYFQIIKPTLEVNFDYKKLHWLD